MATSMRPHLVDADTIYKMDPVGRVEIKTMDQITAEAQQQQQNAAQSAPVGSQASTQSAPATLSVSTDSDPPQVKATASSSARDNLTNKKYGDFSLYRYFLQPAGLSSVLTWLGIICIAAVAERAPQIYARFWLGRSTTNRLYYIGYAALGILAPALSYLQAYSYFHLINAKSSTSLHWALVDAMNRATFEFLTEQDAGALLNRFSQDTSMATQSLPMAIMPTVWGE